MSPGFEKCPLVATFLLASRKKRVRVGNAIVIILLALYPTEDETFPAQEDISDDESNTVKEDHIRREDDNESNAAEEDTIRKEDIEDYMNEKYGKRDHIFNLRPRRMRNYKHLFTQMGFKADIKKFGLAAEEGVLEEFSQLDDYDCLEPRSDLKPEQKQIVLEYLMNIKKSEMEELRQADA